MNWGKNNIHFRVSPTTLDFTIKVSYYFESYK